jgi:membrane-associated phospholipid phosphatase
MTALARWLSIVAHPFVVVGLMVAAAASRRGQRGHSLRDLVIVLAIAILPLAILMIRQVRSGEWENVDASNVAERPILYVVGAIASLSLVAFLILAGSQPVFLRGALGALAAFAVCGFMTPWVKVSLHLAFAAFAATTLTVIGSPVGWMLAATVPALAWARVALGRHRPVEVALGAIIGAACGLIAVRV